MNKHIVFLIPLLLGFAMPVFSEETKAVYKCKTDTGVIYKKSPCASDMETVGHAIERRNKELKEHPPYDEAKDHQRFVYNVTKCFRAGSCTIEEVRTVMRFLKNNELVSLLGQPHRRQLVADEEYWYYNLGGNQYQIVLGKYSNVVNVY